MTELTDRPFFFAADGAWLHPQPAARGPWGETLHGRLLGGLMAREAEAVMQDDDELFCSRLTVDMFRSVGLVPLTVSTRMIREGRRIRVLEVTIESADGPVGQGKAVLLRRSEQPPGRFGTTPAWTAPTPEQIGDPVRRPGGTGFTAPWDSWPIAGDESMKGMRGGMWIRDTHELIEGEALTPLMRVAMAADLASPISNSGTEGLGFINADYTVYLGRAPEGEIVGIQPHAHLSEDGIAVAQCVAHDLRGPIGFIATTALANSMSRARTENPATS